MTSQSVKRKQHKIAHENSQVCSRI